MSLEVLAIPSANPGGLDAGMGMHFGHCDIYTIVNVKDGAIESVSTLPNVPHQQGGCLAPVQHLASHGVTKLLAGGMCRRFWKESSPLFLLNLPAAEDTTKINAWPNSPAMQALRTPNGRTAHLGCTPKMDILPLPSQTEGGDVQNRPCHAGGSGLHP